MLRLLRRANFPASMAGAISSAQHPPLFSLPAWGALLAGGGPAFCGIGGTSCYQAHGLPEAHGLDPGQGAGAYRYFLGSAHGQWRRLAQALCQVPGFGHEVIVRHHFPHQPHCPGALGVDRLADKQEFHGIGPGQALRHADGPDNGRDAQAHFWEAERGPL